MELDIQVDLVPPNILDLERTTLPNKAWDGGGIGWVGLLSLVKMLLLSVFEIALSSIYGIAQSPIRAPFPSAFSLLGSHPQLRHLTSAGWLAAWPLACLLLVSHHAPPPPWTSREACNTMQTQTEMTIIAHRVWSGKLTEPDFYPRVTPDSRSAAVADDPGSPGSSKGGKKVAIEHHHPGGYD